MIAVGSENRHDIVLIVISGGNYAELEDIHRFSPPFETEAPQIGLAKDIWSRCSLFEKDWKQQKAQ